MFKRSVGCSDSPLTLLWDFLVLVDAEFTHAGESWSEFSSRRRLLCESKTRLCYRHKSAKAKKP